MNDVSSSDPRVLCLPDPTPAGCLGFVEEHLGHLVCDTGGAASPRFRGGQAAADAALASFDVSGYAGHRNEVLPVERRGASALSPYIRHGMLELSAVWDHVEGGPQRDVSKFRDELLWQEFSRHWYATLGRRTRRGIRRELSPSGSSGWDRSMRCVDEVVGELEGDGWLVNQTRMWLSSQWAVRDGGDWTEGEDEFFRHLLDGSRAANRLGWQWTTGVGSSKPYGFSRWQVDKRAPGLCAECDLEDRCPIQDWPDDPVYVDSPSLAVGGQLFGPSEVVRSASPKAVWLTAESLGDADPAAVAYPDLPAVFVFDEPLLAGLRLATKRLVFLAETLAEMAQSRPVEVWLGRPAELLHGRDVAVTHAPVPGFVDVAASISPAEVYPWPWLCAPKPGSVSSFSAWRKRVVK